MDSTDIQRTWIFDAESTNRIILSLDAYSPIARLNSDDVIQ